MGYRNQEDRVYWTATEPINKSSVEHTHWRLYSYLLQFIKPIDIVLDVGCGSGGGTALVAKHSESIVGIDPFPNAINYAIENNSGPNIKFLQIEINELTDNQFDTILVIASIEHIVMSEIKVVRKAMDLLKDNGTLIVYFDIGDYSVDEMKKIFEGYQYEIIPWEQTNYNIIVKKQVI